MSTNDNSPVGMMTVDEQVCPACGGPGSLHEETIIRLGSPRRVRNLRRCVDPWCGRSLPLPGTESFEKTGVTE